MEAGRNDPADLCQGVMAMDLIIPDKLKKGDTVRVIAPSRSLGIVSKQVREIATKRLNLLGLNVTFGKLVEECDEFTSSSVSSRLSDIHEAIRDRSIAAVLTAIGGYNCNQLLDGIDYKLFRDNPKILCGFSDITALQNALLTKAGIVTYSGPHYSTFGMELGIEYTLEYFQKCLFSSQPFQVAQAREWSDDQWFLAQKDRKFFPNPGATVIQAGSASGRIVGGNLCTFNLLHGTEYMPNLHDSILFLEDDELKNVYELDRDLQSVLHLPGFSGVKGLLLGRFQKKSGITPEILISIIKSKRRLSDIPIVSDCDFGHTTPQTTFPIGGTASMQATAGSVVVTIEQH